MGKLTINIEADVTRHSTQYRGNLSGTLQDLCFFSGLLIGEMLREAPVGAEVKVCELFAKGMCAGKFGKADYGDENSSVHIPPDVLDVLERLKEEIKEGENGNA